MANLVPTTTYPTYTTYTTTAYPYNKTTAYNMTGDLTKMDHLNQNSDGLLTLLIMLLSAFSAMVSSNDLYLPLELLWGLNLFYEIAKFALQIIISSKRHTNTSISPI